MIFKREKTWHINLESDRWSHLSLDFSQGAFDNLLFNLKENLSMSVPKQEKLLRASLCNHTVHWPLLSHLTAPWHAAVSAGGQQTLSLNNTSGPCQAKSLGGCDTNSYTAPIITKRKVAASKADDLCRRSAILSQGCRGDFLKLRRWTEMKEVLSRVQKTKIWMLSLCHKMFRWSGKTVHAENVGSTLTFMLVLKSH